MRIYDVIRQDHARIATQFDRVLGTLHDLTERRRLFDELRAMLLAHGDAEEVVLYAPLRHGDLESRVDGARREHALVAELLQRLERLTVGDADFQYELVALRDHFRRHADDEENDLLVLAEETLGSDDDGELGRQLEAEERKALRSLQLH